jgi:hypothetical protein
MIDRYNELTVAFCKRHDNTFWLNLAACRTTTMETDRRLVGLKHTRDLVNQTARSGGKVRRRRWEIVNLIGKAAHVLFGILDDEDKSLYIEKISQLEADLTKLSKEQIRVVKLITPCKT